MRLLPRASSRRARRPSAALARPAAGLAADAAPADPDRVTLDAAGQKRIGLAFGTAETRRIVLPLRVPGTVAFDERRVTHLKPRTQGRVLSLAVQPGEIVAVIGRNGVGKSTLMRSLVGLLPASAGGIAFRGAAVEGLAAHRRARLGYVPQGRDVFPRMSVADNLTVGASLLPKGERPDYERAFGPFPILRERRGQRAGTLSGGQQQQLAIGRVLVGGPALILLDEPSEGIQPSVVQQIGRTLVDLNRRTGVTIVFVEQNLDLIRAMAQRSYVMDKGRIVAELTARDLDDRDLVRRHLAV